MAGKLIERSMNYSYCAFTLIRY